MRASKLIFSLLALTLTDAAAVARHDLEKRNLLVVHENVVVTEQVEVVKHHDGSLAIGSPIAVRTALSLSTPSPAPPTVDIPSSPNDSEQQNVPPMAGNDLGPVEQPTEPEATSSETVHEPVQPETNKEPAKAEPVHQDPIPQSELQNSTEQSQIPNVQTFHQKSATGEGKRGIAYNDPNKLNAFTSSSKVSWAYNWGHTASNIPNNMQFVPMLWGTGIHSAGWHEAAIKALSQGCTHFLGFNEPDLGEQSSLSVPLAVAGYRALMQPYAGRAKLGSPAVTNGGAPMGLAYLKEFISHCTGCTIDFVAIHWYNGGSANDFKNHVTKAHEISGGRPVWITEFQGSGDSAQQQAFLNEVLPWLDQQSFVERYAYFMASDGNLISSGTSLSPVGQVFANSN